MAGSRKQPFQSPKLVPELATESAPKHKKYTYVKSWRIDHPKETVDQFGEVMKTIGTKKPKKLYHGTHTNNIQAIVELGLQVGKEACMFGAGIYLGSPAKAFNYIRNASSSKYYYLIEVLAIVGNPLKADKARKFNLKKIQKLGHHSVKGCQGKTITHGKNTLQRSEWVVYHPNQVIVHRIHEYKRATT